MSNMTQVQNVLENGKHLEPLPAKPVKDGSQKRTMTAERVMINIIVIFFVGVLAMTLLPAPYKGMTSGLVSLLLLWSMFKN